MTLLTAAPADALSSLTLAFEDAPQNGRVALVSPAWSAYLAAARDCAQEDNNAPAVIASHLLRLVIAGQRRLGDDLCGRLWDTAGEEFAARVGDQLMELADSRRVSPEVEFDLLGLAYGCGVI
jgi:hypothetical protein